MSIPNSTYRFLIEKFGDSDPTQFVGNEGEVFYDPNNPSLKLSDGITPGGLSIGGTGGFNGNGGFYWIQNNSGIHTLGNVGVGTTDSRFLLEVGSVGSSGTSLYVNGGVRITGILSIGSSSITLDGNLNTVTVGSGVTINGETGDIIATSLTIGEETLTSIGQISTGNISFSEEKIIGSATTEFNLGVIQLVPSLDDEEGGTLFVTNGQYLNIYPTTLDDAPHIHITAGTLSTTSNYYYYDEENPIQYLKGDLFLGDDNNYVSVYGNGRIQLYSGGYGSYIDVTDQIVLNSSGSIDLNSSGSIDLNSSVSIDLDAGNTNISLSSLGALLSVSEINENSGYGGLVGITSQYTGLIGINSEYAGLVGFTSQFSNYSAIGGSEYGIVLQIHDGNNIYAPPDNSIGIYKSGTYFGLNYCFGKVEDNSVIGISTSLIYETNNFIGVGSTIGSLKLIIQCNGDGGGTQLSELLVIKQYGGENVYQSETSRATSGIGTVNFISSYNSENESIEVYAESSDEQIWSIRVVPLEIKS